MSPPPWYVWLLSLLGLLLLVGLLIYIWPFPAPTQDEPVDGLPPRWLLAVLLMAVLIATLLLVARLVGPA